MKLSLVVLCAANTAQAFLPLSRQQSKTTVLKAGEYRDDAYAAQYNAFAANHNANAAQRGLAPIAPIMPQASSATSSVRDDQFRSGAFREMADSFRDSIAPAPPGPATYAPIQPYQNQNYGGHLQSESTIRPLQPNSDQNYGRGMQRDPTVRPIQPYRDQNYGGALRPDTTLGQRPISRPYGSNPYGYMNGGGTQQVQGNSRNTYSTYGGSQIVDLTTNGRDMYADVEMWSGPSNTPQKLRVYSQDGYTHGIRSVHSSASPTSLSVRNHGRLEFPLNAAVSQVPQQETAQAYSTLPGRQGGVLLQGEGGVKTFAIPPEVQSIMLTLQTEGRPLYSKLEVLEGPNNVKVGADLYNDGMHGASQLIIDTPGLSKSLRIKNTGPMVYPFHATVEPHSYGDPYAYHSRPNPNLASRFDANGRYRGDPLEDSNSYYGDYGGNRLGSASSRFDSTGRYRGDSYRYGVSPQLSYSRFDSNGQFRGW